MHVVLECPLTIHPQLDLCCAGMPLDDPTQVRQSEGYGYGYGYGYDHFATEADGTEQWGGV